MFRNIKILKSTPLKKIIEQIIINVEVKRIKQYVLKKSIKKNASQILREFCRNFA